MIAPSVSRYYTFFIFIIFFFFSSRRRHTRWPRDWSSDVCSSDLLVGITIFEQLMLLPLLALGLTSLFGVRTIFGHRMFLLLPLFVIPVWGRLNGVVHKIRCTAAGGVGGMLGQQER